MQVVDKAPPPISLGADMPRGEEFFYQSGVAFAALGFSKFEELFDREVTRMRRHKVEETGLHFGVTEGAKREELGLLDAHRSQAVDRRREFPFISDAPQTICLLGPGINLKADTSLFRKTTGAVVVCR